MLLLTYVVNSKGLICTYDTINDLYSYDEFDVLFLTDEDGVGTRGMEAGIEKFTLGWRVKGSWRRRARRAARRRTGVNLRGESYR